MKDLGCKNMYILDAKIAVGKRIKELRGPESSASFCKKFNIHRNTLPRYESGLRIPDGEFLAEVAEHYKVHTDWILLGNLPKYRGNIEYFQPNSEDYDYIPMVEARLSAGDGNFVESEGVRGYYAFKKDWISRVTNSVRSLVLMRITGDSMFPTLHKNDTVLVDTSRKDIKEGEIYAIRYDHTIMVKRLSYRPGHKIIVISDNKNEFEPYEIAPHDLNIIGQVIFFSRVMIPEAL